MRSHWGLHVFHLHSSTNPSTWTQSSLIFSLRSLSDGSKRLSYYGLHQRDCPTEARYRLRLRWRTQRGWHSLNMRMLPGFLCWDPASAEEESSLKLCEIPTSGRWPGSQVHRRGRCEGCEVVFGGSVQCEVEDCGPKFPVERDRQEEGGTGELSVWREESRP